MRWTCV